MRTAALLLATCCLLALKPAAVAQSMQSDWLAKWANARDYTLAVAAAMPAAEYTYRPTDSTRTFGEQLVHLADNITWLSTSKLSDGERPESAAVDPADSAAVRAYLGQAFETGADALGHLTYAELEQPVAWFTGETLTRRRVGLLLFDHVTHHRAQAIVYVRLRGLRAPAYVGW